MTPLLVVPVGASDKELKAGIKFLRWLLLSQRQERAAVAYRASHSTDDSMRNACTNCGQYHDGPCGKSAEAGER